METKTTTIIALAILALAISACSFSSGTAGLNGLSFGKNKEAKPPATTFNTGELIYAVVEVANAADKSKLKLNLLYDNVAGQTKGGSALKNELDISGNSEAFFSFDSGTPGDYKVEVALVDSEGKEVSKKSGNITIKGTAPAESSQTKANPNAEISSEKAAEDK